MTNLDHRTVDQGLRAGEHGLSGYGEKALNERLLLPWGKAPCIAKSSAIVLGPQSEIKKMTGSLVSVVDDDESVRESLPRLVKTFGFTVCAFSSAEEFLASGTQFQTGCLILDIAMPGMSGPELQIELKRRQLEIPTIFITAVRDETVRKSMLERGAVECLFKPFAPTALREALKVAFRV